MENKRLIKSSKKVPHPEQTADEEAPITTFSLSQDLAVRSSALAASLCSLADTLQSTGESAGLKGGFTAAGLNATLDGAARSLAFADNTLQVVADYLGVKL